MDTQAVKTDDAPMAVGPYSQGIITGNLVFVSGQIPVNPLTGDIPASIEEQTELALKNMIAVMNAAGVLNKNISSTTVYLTDINDFSQMNLVYASHFEEPCPARACVAVAALPKGVKIMISGIGVKTE